MVSLGVTIRFTQDTNGWPSLHPPSKSYQRTYTKGWGAMEVLKVPPQTTSVKIEHIVMATITSFRTPQLIGPLLLPKVRLERPLMDPIESDGNVPYVPYSKSTSENSTGGGVHGMRHDVILDGVHTVVDVMRNAEGVVGNEVTMGSRDKSEIGVKGGVEGNPRDDGRGDGE